MTKVIFKKIFLYPPLLCFFGNILFSVVTLLNIFSFHKENTWYAPVFYAFACLTLVQLVYRIVITVIKEKKKAKNLENHSTFRKVLTTVPYAKLLLTLSCSGVFHFLYAIVRFVYGLVQHSVFQTSIGIYYLFLSLIKIFLVLYAIKVLKTRDLEKKDHLLNKADFYIGFCLLALNLGMTLMVYLMVFLNMSNPTHPFLIYGQAFIAFLSLFTAITGYIKSKKYSDPLLNGTKTVQLVSAAMSILILQVGLLERFSSDPLMSNTFNLLSGTFVFLLCFAFALQLIITSVRRAKKLKAENL